MSHSSYIFLLLFLLGCGSNDSNVKGNNETDLNEKPPKRTKRKNNTSRNSNSTNKRQGKDKINNTETGGDSTHSPKREEPEDKLKEFKSGLIRLLGGPTFEAMKRTFSPGGMNSKDGEEITNAKELCDLLLKDINQSIEVVKDGKKSSLSILQMTVESKKSKLLEHLLTHPSIDLTDQKLVTGACMRKDIEIAKILLKDKRTVPPVEYKALSRLLGGYLRKPNLATLQILIQNLKENTNVGKPDAPPLWPGLLGPASTDLRSMVAVKLISALLENPQFSLDSKNRNDRTLLEEMIHIFCFGALTNKIEEVVNLLKNILSDNPRLLNVLDSKGRTPLVASIIHAGLDDATDLGKYVAFDAIWEATDNKEKEKSTKALEQAARALNQHCFTALLAHVKVLDFVDHDDDTLLHLIATDPFSKNSVPMYKALMDKLKNKAGFSLSDYINKENMYCDTALHRAVRTKNIKMVEELLKVPGIDITIENLASETPLQEATRRGYNEIADMLRNHTG